MESLTKVIDQSLPAKGAAASGRPARQVTPIFCIPPAGGNALVYRHLARELAAELPVIALQPPGLDGKQEPFNRVEDLAAYYLAEIRRQQPQGPYVLVGVCFGCMIAYELARQLGSSGQKVRMTALIDPVLPVPSNVARAVGKMGSAWSRHRRNMASLRAGQRISYVSARAWNSLRRPVIHFARWLQLAGHQFSRRLSGKTSGAIAKASVFTAEVSAWNNYVPPPSGEKLFLLWSSWEYSQSGQDHEVCWRRAARGAVSTFTLGCGHDDVLENESNSRRVASALLVELAAAPQ